MKRIIALYGHAQCGKTSCLNMVRELLRANSEGLSSNPPYSGDKCETFRYKGQIVCICPGGDTKELIASNFKYSISKNADVIITGSRSKGAPVQTVEKYANIFAIDIEWRRKCIEYDLSKETQHLCNKEFAEMIFKML
ncbi:MAG: hypothetical protein NC116_12100 [Clostridium sp.]|nr:hypothetical protein [Clostridium sp.]